MKMSAFLYRAARASRDAEAVRSGDPKRITRRVANHAKGRLLARAGFWRFLWGGKP